MSPARDERRQWQTLTESLAELERTDPDVRAAAESLDRVVDSILLRRHVPRRRFHKSTEDHGVEVER